MVPGATAAAAHLVSLEESVLHLADLGQRVLGGIHLRDKHLVLSHHVSSPGVDLLISDAEVPEGVPPRALDKVRCWSPWSPW